MKSGLEFRNVNFGYRKKKLVFNNLSLQLNGGKCYAIAGVNGAGKTTFFRLAVGLEKAQSGEIFVFNQQINSKALKSIRQQVGFVFENPDNQLFATSVKQEVEFGPRNLGWSEDQIIEARDQALTSVNLSNLIDSSPYQLSFGQKKRVAIAAVLAMKPKLLLLDEPMSNLDLPATLGLIKTLRNIQVEKTSKEA